MGESKDNESKLAFGRSRSLIDGSIKLNELRSMESDSTFYSCNSDEVDVAPTPKSRYEMESIFFYIQIHEGEHLKVCDYA